MSGLPQPVRCIETGIVYRSLRQAARALRTSPQAISAALRGLRPQAGGRTWEEVAPTEVLQ